MTTLDSQSGESRRSHKSISQKMGMKLIFILSLLTSIFGVQNFLNGNNNFFDVVILFSSILFTLFFFALSLKETFRE